MKMTELLVLLNKQQKLLKVLEIVHKSVMVWSMRLIIFGDSFVIFWRDIIDLIPFQVFLILYIANIFKILFYFYYVAYP